MVKLFLFYIISILVIATSCTTYQNNSGSRNMNVSFIYNPSSSVLNSQFIAFNETDTTSRIYFKIKNKGIMYVPNGETSQAIIKLHYLLYNSSKTMLLVDSGTFYYHFKQTNSDDLIKSFEVKTKDTVPYFLDLTVYDANQNAGNQSFLSIDRSQRINKDDALIVDKNNIPYFEPLHSDTDTFKIVLRKKLPLKWTVSWFQNKFMLRPAPYSLGNYNRFIPPKPDSTRVVWLTDTSTFTLKNDGIIHFYQDTLKLGFSVLEFYQSFPEITTPVSLLQPLRMLTTQKEFNDMNLLANKKESVDKFWLNAGGNVNRARELIRVFYTRVMLANKYFTSYTEGWKTDRGLIYIVFGLPVTIYKADGIERWIYGTSQSNKTLVFNFIRQQNPFTNNDFTLVREEMYKISWTQAVDTWRNGRVYSVAY